jgi:hypothetical protein
MHRVGYLPGISAGCTDNKTLKNRYQCLLKCYAEMCVAWLFVKPPSIFHTNTRYFILEIIELNCVLFEYVHSLNIFIHLLCIQLSHTRSINL